MNIPTQKDFKESTSLKMIWNHDIVWHNIRLATAMWHWNSWKVISKDAKSNEWEERSYEPIAEFHTQAELWEYIKNNFIMLGGE